MAIGQKRAEHVVPLVGQGFLGEEAVIRPGPILFQADDHLADRIAANEFFRSDHGTPDRFALVIAVEE